MYNSPLSLTSALYGVDGQGHGPVAYTRERSVPTAQETERAPGQVWSGAVFVAINYVLGATVLCGELISDQVTNSIPT
jgi:hypothetical protein